METTHAYELLAAYTAEQWGMVTTRQAKNLGVDAVTLHRLTKTRFLNPVRRGVYAATAAAVSTAREEQAIWLALNPSEPGWSRPLIDPDGGVLSHESAAHLQGLGELGNDRITLTVPRRRDIRDRDIRTKIAVLTEADVTTLDGLPVTTVLRTVRDLLGQHLDASHIAAVIRDGVETGQLQLDELINNAGPYARLYGYRPGDGEGLIEHVLSQIGLTSADLASRTGPAAPALGTLWNSEGLRKTPIIQEVFQGITAPDIANINLSQLLGITPLSNATRKALTATLGLHPVQFTDLPLPTRDLGSRLTQTHKDSESEKK